jgi:starch-binding outer membrane protein, SusD/RagB family
MKKLIALCLLCLACTDLQEVQPIEALPNQYFTSKETVAQIPIQAYSSLHHYIWNYWYLSEVPSDEVYVLPNEGDGNLESLDLHYFWLENSRAIDFWKQTYQAIGNCNNAIYQQTLFQGFEEQKKQQKAEIRVLRAFYYYQLIDIFGNVSILKSVEETLKNQPQASRKAVYAFCEKEILEAIKDLPAQNDYGKINQSIAYTLLAKLYLNAGVFNQKEAWQQCIDACDAVINTGKYALTEDFYDNFKIQNENSKEIIFPIGFSSKIDLGWPNMNHYMLSLHYNQLPVSPWNGFSTIAEVYDGFDEKDERRKAMWEGQQYAIMQWPAKGLQGEKLKTRSGNLLYFQKEVGRLSRYNYGEEAGVRVVKYEPDVKAPVGQAENDFVIFRYADVLLSKAEALMRLNRKSEAEAIINSIRKRAKIETINNSTLKSIYQERGREFYWEGFRRQDMIRFDEFLKPHAGKERWTESNKVLYPIPPSILSENPNLKQNEGYSN